MDPFDGQQKKKAPLTTAWMVTFTDLVSLMLTFFVMMYAMSTVQVDKWQAMTDVLSRSKEPTAERPVTPPSVNYNIATEIGERAINLEYLAAVLEGDMQADPILASSRMLMKDDRLVIALPGDLLFETGRADLSAKASDALFRLGGILRNIKNQLAVNGHTDPTPIRGGAFAGNWDLSLARAAAVANALRKSGYTREIMAFGFADGRFHELPDFPEAERHSLARRVDVVIMSTGAER